MEVDRFEEFLCLWSSVRGNRRRSFPDIYKKILFTYTQSTTSLFTNDRRAKTFAFFATASKHTYPILPAGVNSTQRALGQLKGAGV
jgi:hypothetical protein